MPGDGEADRELRERSAPIRRPSGACAIQLAWPVAFWLIANHSSGAQHSAEHPQPDVHRAPAAVQVQQPQRLGYDHQHRVVLGRERERRRDHPRGERPRRRVARARVGEREQRRAASAARAARTPAPPASTRSAAGCTAVSAAAITPARREISFARGAVHDRDRQHAAHRRQRPQADLAVAEDPRPHPRDAVVQRRRRLVVLDQRRASARARSARRSAVLPSSNQNPWWPSR